MSNLNFKKMLFNIEELGCGLHCDCDMNYDCVESSVATYIKMYYINIKKPCYYQIYSTFAFSCTNILEKLRNYRNSLIKIKCCLINIKNGHFNKYVDLKEFKKEYKIFYKIEYFNFLDFRNYQSRIIGIEDHICVDLGGDMGESIKKYPKEWVFDDQN
jgi:hypothetical protein